MSAECLVGRVVIVMFYVLGTLCFIAGAVITFSDWIEERRWDRRKKVREGVGWLGRMVREGTLTRGGSK